MATLKVSVTTMSTINDEIKSNRSVISSSTSSTVNISTESSGDHQDINTIRTSTQTTTTTTTNGNDASSEDEKEPGGNKGCCTAVVKVSQESSHRFRASKTKIYRVKNVNWYCQKCDIYCNSEPQFEVHMMSQKHKVAVSGGLLSPSLVELNLALAKVTQDEPKLDTADLVCVPKRTSQAENEADQDDSNRKKLNPISEYHIQGTGPS